MILKQRLEKMDKMCKKLLLIKCGYCNCKVIVEDNFDKEFTYLAACPLRNNERLSELERRIK